MNDVSSYNMERVITIKGSIESMSSAEAMISSKLRQSYESDLQAMAVRLKNLKDIKFRFVYSRSSRCSRKT